MSRKYKIKKIKKHKKSKVPFKYHIKDGNYYIKVNGKTYKASLESKPVKEKK